MGLPGAGKTYLAERLKAQLEQHGSTVSWLNADEVRRHFNDWDFSKEGRIRQSLRMRDLSEEANTATALWTLWRPCQKCATISRLTGLYGWTPLTEDVLKIPIKCLCRLKYMISVLLNKTEKSGQNSLLNTLWKIVADPCLIGKKKLCKCWVVGNLGTRDTVHCLSD